MLNPSPTLSISDNVFLSLAIRRNRRLLPTRGRLQNFLFRLFSFSANFVYASFALIPRFFGFINESENSSNGILSKISPLPLVICFPPSKQKFKSEPSFAQSSCNSFLSNGSSKFYSNRTKSPQRQCFRLRALPQQECFFRYRY